MEENEVKNEIKHEEKKSGLATAGLVLGIIGVCTSFIPLINNLSFVLGLIGILFAIICLVQKASKKKAIAAIIFCVLAMYFTIQAQQSLSDSLNELNTNWDKMAGNSTQDVLENDADVVLGEFEVTKGSYGITDTKLPVTVTNKTEETKSISIQIEAVNDDGSRITTDYVYANNLGAGQSQSFNAFTFVTSEDLESMKSATFKIVEVSIY